MLLILIFLTYFVQEVVEILCTFIQPWNFLDFRGYHNQNKNKNDLLKL